MPNRTGWKFSVVNPMDYEGWAAHFAEWDHCKRCGLCKDRRKVVRPRGVAPCDILLIGEAPGEAEDLRGHAFVGPAGNVLNGILEEAYKGRKPPRICIDNIVACIPLKDGLEEGEIDVRPPSAQEARACRPRLEEIVKLCNPKLVITLGKVAAKHFLAWDLPVHGMIHPAALLGERMTASRATMARKRCVLHFRGLKL